MEIPKGIWRLSVFQWPSTLLANQVCAPFFLPLCCPWRTMSRESSSCFIRMWWSLSVTSWEGK